VYTPNQFRILMLQAVASDTEVAIYIALAGLAFCRSQELVRRFKGEAVLEWSDIQWDRKQLHVRPGVAKSTRRKSGNERFTPIHKTLLEWLKPLSKGKSGRIISASVRSFRTRLQNVFESAEVAFIDNGLRHSAISYWLAGHPGSELRKSVSGPVIRSSPAGCITSRF
jgi:integrase